MIVNQCQYMISFFIYSEVIYRLIHAKAWVRREYRLIFWLLKCSPDIPKIPCAVKNLSWATLWSLRVALHLSAFALSGYSRVDLHFLDPFASLCPNPDGVDERGASSSVCRETPSKCKLAVRGGVREGRC